jgi:hypothetical protein
LARAAGVLAVRQVALHKKAMLQKRRKPIGTTGLWPKKAGLPARTQS